MILSFAKYILDFGNCSTSPAISTSTRKVIKGEQEYLWKNGRNRQMKKTRVQMWPKAARKKERKNPGDGPYLKTWQLYKPELHSHSNFYFYFYFKPLKSSLCGWGGVSATTKHYLGDTSSIYRHKTYSQQLLYPSIWTSCPILNVEARHWFHNVSNNWLCYKIQLSSHLVEFLYFCVLLVLTQGIRIFKPSKMLGGLTSASQNIQRRDIPLNTEKFLHSI